MAAGTLNFIDLAVHSAKINVLHNILVTTPTSRLRNLQIKPCDLNVVWIAPCSEIEGVKKTVTCLDGILAYEIVRRMAIVASRGRVVARFHPRIVLDTHSMAIGAGGRIIQHVRVPLCVNKAVPCHPKKYAND